MKPKSLKSSKKNTEFEEWAEQVMNNTPNSGMFDPGNFKKDLEHHEEILEKAKNDSTRLRKMPPVR